MAVRTYGDKPISFQLEENGEYYCVGSEVSHTIFSQLNTKPKHDSLLGGQLPAPLPRFPLQKIPGHVSSPHH